LYAVGLEYCTLKPCRKTPTLSHIGIFYHLHCTVFITSNRAIKVFVWTCIFPVTSVYYFIRSFAFTVFVLGSSLLCSGQVTERNPVHHHLLPPPVTAAAAGQSGPQSRHPSPSPQDLTTTQPGHLASGLLHSLSSSSSSSSNTAVITAGSGGGGEQPHSTTSSSGAAAIAIIDSLFRCHRSSNNADDDDTEEDGEEEDAIEDGRGSSCPPRLRHPAQPRCASRAPLLLDPAAKGNFLSTNPLRPRNEICEEGCASGCGADQEISWKIEKQPPVMQSSPGSPTDCPSPCALHVERQLCRHIGDWGESPVAPLVVNPGESEEDVARRLTAEEQRTVGLPPLSSPDPSLSSIRLGLAHNLIYHPYSQQQLCVSYWYIF
jgi:hypothetical protein